MVTKIFITNKFVRIVLKLERKLYLNNFHEHTNENTVISCLDCNLQRRKKNSQKFKFTKQLTIKKIV